MNKSLQIALIFAIATGVLLTIFNFFFVWEPSDAAVFNVPVSLFQKTDNNIRFADTNIHFGSSASPITEIHVTSLDGVDSLEITGGSPGLNKVLTSNATGVATWQLASGGGFTDVGTTIILTNINDDVGIGVSSPNAKLEVGGTPGSSVGGFPSGQLHVTNPSTSEFSNSVITLHNKFGGNTQLGYIGSVSGSNNDIGFINRQNAGMVFLTNNLQRMRIEADGTINITGVLTAGQLNADNLRLDGNTLSTISGDLDVTTFTGGVFKFVDNAFQAGLDASNFIEVGHGGSNSFLNQVGAGGMDFRFEGVTKATFTAAGHLHLTTDTDQKHNLKIITANNANDSGIAWENSGGNFSQTIFRTDVGGNRSDLVFAIGSDANIDNLTNAMRIHGEASDLGNVEFFKNVGIGFTSPSEKLEVNGNIVATTIIDKTIFAQLNSSVDQISTTTNPTVITYNKQDGINGLTHSTTTNAGEITINTAGIYFVSPQPQVGKDSGGLKVDFDMFLQVDRGSGFVDEDNSTIKLTIKDADITDVIVSAFTIQLNAGDKIRIMQKTSATGVGMGLKNTDPVVGPPSVPRTPSIIFTMYRIGGI